MTFLKPEPEERLASKKQIDLILKICTWRKICPPNKLLNEKLTMDEAGIWIDNNYPPKKDGRVWK